MFSALPSLSLLIEADLHRLSERRVPLINQALTFIQKALKYRNGNQHDVLLLSDVQDDITSFDFDFRHELRERALSLHLSDARPPWPFLFHDSSILSSMRLMEAVGASSWRNTRGIYLGGVSQIWDISTRYFRARTTLRRAPDPALQHALSKRQDRQFVGQPPRDDARVALPRSLQKRADGVQRARQPLERCAIQQIGGADIHPGTMRAHAKSPRAEPHVVVGPVPASNGLRARCRPVVPERDAPARRSA